MVMKLTEKAALISFSSILMKLSLIVSGIFVVRFLTQVQLGSFRQANLIFGTLNSLLILGIPSSLYYFVPRASNSEKRGIIFQTIAILFLIGVISASAIYVFAPYVSSQFNNSGLTILLRRYAPYLIFSLPASSFFAIMVCLEKVGIASLMRVGVVCVQIFATLLPVIMGYDLSTVFTVMLFSNSTIAVITIWYSIKSTPTGSLFASKSFTLNQFRFSLPLGLSQMVSLLSKEIDKFFISKFFVVKEFAVYSVGAMELPLASLFASSIRTVLLPEFSKKFKDNDRKQILITWKESRRKLAIITFPFVFFFF